MDKSPDAFRTISEVAEVLETPAHVLRFWESRFPQIRPVKRAGGRRYYRPSDIALLTGIKRLLHDEGLTIRGVQKILRDQGVRHVAGLSNESVSVKDLMVTASPTDADLADRSGPKVRPDLAAPEPAAAPIETTDKVEALPPPVKTSPVQPPLPLFEAAPPLRAMRDDQTLAAVIRALHKDHSAPRREAMAAVARRLAALRATMADRADGGPG
ncbi:MAG: MerR family transcriptional regulator [Rhodobacterales bacterium]|nr:MerR family transcriptional regulator [Rhodobacterales bacterium]